MAETKAVTLKQSTNKTSSDCLSMDQKANSHYQINRLSSVLKSGPAIQNSLDLNVTRKGSLTRFTLEVSSRKTVLHHNQVQKSRKVVLPETLTLLLTIQRRPKGLQSLNVPKTERTLVKPLNKLQVEMKFQSILRPLLRFATARQNKSAASLQDFEKQLLRWHSRRRRLCA